MYRALSDEHEVSSGQAQGPISLMENQTDMVGEKWKEGNAFFSKGDYFQASRCYSDAIQLACPDNATLYCNRAACSLALHQFKSAIDDADKALSIDPNLIKAYYRKAAAQISMGYMHAAKSTAAAGLRCDERSKDIKKIFDQCQLFCRQAPFLRNQTVRVIDSYPKLGNLLGVVEWSIDRSGNVLVAFPTKSRCHSIPRDCLICIFHLGDMVILIKSPQVSEEAEIVEVLKDNNYLVRSVDGSRQFKVQGTLLLRNFNSAFRPRAKWKQPRQGDNFIFTDDSSKSGTIVSVISSEMCYTRWDNAADGEFSFVHTSYLLIPDAPSQSHKTTQKSTRNGSEKMERNGAPRKSMQRSPSPIRHQCKEDDRGDSAASGIHQESPSSSKTSPTLTTTDPNDNADEIALIEAVDKACTAGDAGDAAILMRVGQSTNLASDNRWSLVRKILEHGGDVDAMLTGFGVTLGGSDAKKADKQDKASGNSETLLHVAARENNESMVMWLLEKGASPSKQSSSYKLAEELTTDGEIAVLLRAAREKLKKEKKSKKKKKTKKEAEQQSDDAQPTEEGASNGDPADSTNGAAEAGAMDPVVPVATMQPVDPLQALVDEVILALAHAAASGVGSVEAGRVSEDSAISQGHGAETLDAASTESGRAAGLNKPVQEDCREYVPVRSCDAPAGAEDDGCRVEIDHRTRGQRNFAPTVSEESSPAPAVDDCYDDIWEIEITREARQQWEALDRPVRRAVESCLSSLAAGRWANHMRSTQHVYRGLNLFRANFLKGGRVLWEKAVSFSAKQRCFTEVVRVWAVCADHDKQTTMIKRIEESHRKGSTANIRRRLRAHKIKGASPTQFDQDGYEIKLPQKFEVVDSDLRGGDLDFPAESLRAREEEEFDSLIWYPPAVPSADSYVLLKFYECTRVLRRQYCAELDERRTTAEFPFRLSPKEHEVCDLETKPHSAILLLGRSGTGKTTCLAFRMWARHKAWHDAYARAQDLLQDSQGLTQMFLTANPVLRAEVRTFFDSLSRGEADDQRHPALARGRLECGLDTPALKGVPIVAFPLFLTKRELLVLLDGTLERPFFDRLADLSLSEASSAVAWGRLESSSSRGLFDCIEDLDGDGEDDENYEGNGAAAAAAAMPAAGRARASAPAASRSSRLAPLAPASHAALTGAAAEKGEAAACCRRLVVEVDYEFFAAVIWPRMKAKGQLTPFTRSISATLVWTEITSFIKGSFESMEAGALTLKQYDEIGKKRAPNFLGKRDEIYRLFEEYEREKANIGGFDLCDLLFHIHHEFRRQEGLHAGVKNGYLGVHIHEVYVDEVQDFLECEIALLALFADPNRLFLTGDSAQTIARGLSFRFTDIKTVLYKAKEQRDPLINFPREIHKLTNNYRTHSGILNLANSVIDLILHFFPSSIDRLEHDRGLFDGPKPWLLQAATFEDLYVLLLGSDNESQIEFGAQQCIIVRDAACKATIPEELRNGGLVCSVFESKGLEFNDVVIYNFFKDSPVKNVWRCILGVESSQQASALLARPSQEKAAVSGLTTSSMDGDVDISTGDSVLISSAANQSADKRSATSRPPHADRPAGGKSRPALEFSEEEHKILLEELRYLYTAVTRARVNVWFYDESLEARGPMFQYFEAKGLVRMVSSVLDLDELKITKGASTSQAEWCAQGKCLFEKNAFSLAQTCFEKGRDTKRAAVAQANALVRSTPPNESPSERKLRFRRAGELFLQSWPCDLSEKSVQNAARCFKYAGEFAHASALFAVLGDNAQSVKCMEAGSFYLEAGRRRLEMGATNLAIKAFSKCTKKADILLAMDALLECGETSRCVDFLLQKSYFLEALKLVDGTKSDKLSDHHGHAQSRTKICLDAARQLLLQQPRQTLSKESEVDLEEDGLEEGEGKVKVDSVSKLGGEGAVGKAHGQPANQAAALEWLQRVDVGSLDKVEQLLREFRQKDLLVKMFQFHGRHSKAVEVLAEDNRFKAAAHALEACGEAVLAGSEIAQLYGRCLVSAGDRWEDASRVFRSLGDEAEEASLAALEALRPLTSQQHGPLPSSLSSPSSPVSALAACAAVDPADLAGLADSSIQEAPPNALIAIVRQELKALICLRSSWGVFWALSIVHRLFGDQAFLIVCGGQEVNAKDMLNEALLLVRSIVASPAGDQSAAFFGFTASDIRPGYCRFDRLSARLLSLLRAGDSAFQFRTESPASHSLLIFPTAELENRIVKKVMSTVFESWHIGFDAITRSLVSEVSLTLTSVERKEESTEAAWTQQHRHKNPSQQQKQQKEQFGEFGADRKLQAAARLVLTILKISDYSIVRKIEGVDFVSCVNPLMELVADAVGRDISHQLAAEKCYLLPHRHSHSIAVSTRIVVQRYFQSDAPYSRLQRFARLLHPHSGQDVKANRANLAASILQMREIALALGLDLSYFIGKLKALLGEFPGLTVVFLQATDICSQQLSLASTQSTYGLLAIQSKGAALQGKVVAVLEQICAVELLQLRACARVVAKEQKSCTLPRSWLFCHIAPYEAWVKAGVAAKTRGMFDRLPSGHSHHPDMVKPRAAEEEAVALAALIDQMGNPTGFGTALSAVGFALYLACQYLTSQYRETMSSSGADGRNIRDRMILLILTVLLNLQGLDDDEASKHTGTRLVDLKKKLKVFVDAYGTGVSPASEASPSPAAEIDSVFLGALKAALHDRSEISSQEAAPTQDITRAATSMARTTATAEDGARVVEGPTAPASVTATATATATDSPDASTTLAKAAIRISNAQFDPYITCAIRRVDSTLRSRAGKSSTRVVRVSELSLFEREFAASQKKLLEAVVWRKAGSGAADVWRRSDPIEAPRRRNSRSRRGGSQRVGVMNNVATAVKAAPLMGSLMLPPPAATTGAAATAAATALNQIPLAAVEISGGSSTSDNLSGLTPDTAQQDPENMDEAILFSDDEDEDDVDEDVEDDDHDDDDDDDDEDDDEDEDENEHADADDHSDDGNRLDMAGSSRNDMQSDPHTASSLRLDAAEFVPATAVAAPTVQSLALLLRCANAATAIQARARGYLVRRKQRFRASAQPLAPGGLGEHQLPPGLGTLGTPAMPPQGEDQGTAAPEFAVPTAQFMALQLQQQQQQQQQLQRAQAFELQRQNVLRLALQLQPNPYPVESYLYDNPSVLIVIDANATGTMWKSCFTNVVEWSRVVAMYLMRLLDIRDYVVSSQMETWDKHAQYLRNCNQLEGYARAMGRYNQWFGQWHGIQRVLDSVKMQISFLGMQPGGWHYWHTHLQATLPSFEHLVGEAQNDMAFLSVSTQAGFSPLSHAAVLPPNGPIPLMSCGSADANPLQEEVLHEVVDANDYNDDDDDDEEHFAATKVRRNYRRGYGRKGR